LLTSRLRRYPQRAPKSCDRIESWYPIPWYQDLRAIVRSFPAAGYSSNAADRPLCALAWSCSNVTAPNDLFRHRSDRRRTTAMPEDDLAPIGILPRPLQCGPTSSRMSAHASLRAELGIAARNGTSPLRRSPLIECARAPSRRACAQPDGSRHRSNQPATLSGRAPALASSPCVGTVLAYGLSLRPQVALGMYD
jgi:hypothetical protein